MTRARVRDLGITIGRFSTGPHNAITDVPGVLVGHSTLIAEEPRVTRTGVTVIVPRDGAIGKDYAFAGFHRFNGCGEMTGVPWLEETGLLSSAIALTNTHQVGMMRDALAQYAWSQERTGPFYLPVVAETYDGWLNAGDALPLTPQHLFDAMDAAKSGPVAEGSVGGGTGMICCEFKGGIGTSSRVVQAGGETYTVGVLVQTNFGDRPQLRVDGVPVGRMIGYEAVPSPWKAPPQLSSIIIIVGTDAPLLSDQCRRLAQRATVGLARTGGTGQNSSGDLFLAFATGNHVPAAADKPFPLGMMLPNQQLNPFFEATAEAVEESIINALTAADTITGPAGRKVYALPLNDLQHIMAKYRS